jgi:uncharacterized protein YndB with AHSA1/START domain
MVHREVTFPVSADRLWELVTEPSSLTAWFGWHVEWELAPGGDARFEDELEGVRDGRVEDVLPCRHLRFQWWPESDPSSASEVVYELEPTDGGTRLTITEEPVAHARRAGAADSTALVTIAETPASSGARVQPMRPEASAAATLLAA